MGSTIASLSQETISRPSRPPDTGQDMNQSPSEDETQFLNVDLDIEAPFDLAPLVAALGDDVFDLYTGPARDGFETHLELAGERSQPDSADGVIREFVRLLSQLAPDAKQLWERATRRDFNIGIQAGRTPHASEFALPCDVLAAVADLGARIVITVYAVA
jgi:hypothetical protein